MTQVVSLLGRRRVTDRIGRALTAITKGLPDDKPEKPAPPKDKSAASKLPKPGRDKAAPRDKGDQSGEAA